MSAITSINSQGSANPGTMASRQPAPQPTPVAVRQNSGGAVEDASSKISSIKA